MKRFILAVFAVSLLVPTFSLAKDAKVVKVHKPKKAKKSHKKK